MNIITKIKENIFSLFEKKYFRIVFFIIIFILILKNYSTLPNKIEKAKKDNPNIFSITNIKKTVDKQILIKNEIQKNNIQKNIESQQNKKENTESQQNKEIKKTEEIKKTNNTILLKNAKIFVVEMILYKNTPNNIITKIDDLNIASTDNIFAPFIKNKKAGETVIVPIEDFLKKSQQNINLPKTQDKFFYKFKIKEIKNIENLEKK